MYTATADVETVQASLNLKKLCRHFGHKVEVRFNDHTGVIHFPFGTGRLAADTDTGILRMQAEAADEAALAQVEQVLADHLVRFAHKETLSVHWRRDATTAEED